MDKLIVLLILFFTSCNCLCLSMDAATFKTAKTLSVKGVIISNFYGTIVVKDSTFNRRAQVKLDYKIRDGITTSLREKNQSLNNIKLRVENSTLIITGSPNTYAQLELLLNSNMPLKISIEHGGFNIESRSSNTEIDMKSSSGKIGKFSSKLICAMSGDSKIIIDEIYGDAKFILSDSSKADLLSGSLNTADITVFNKSNFAFHGIVKNQLKYLAKNFGVISVQYVPGKIIRGGIADEAKVIIEMKEQK